MTHLPQTTTHEKGNPLTWPDEELVRQAQRFDQRALATIHQRYFDPVYNYALYRTSDPSLADDIASEVFVRFLEAMRAQKTAPRSLRAWLLGTASHIVADYYRGEYRHETIQVDDIQHWPTPEEESPFATIESGIQREALYEALDRLTEAQREVVALRFGAALSVKETARVMGKTTGAVKLLQFRALANLRKWLWPDHTRQDEGQEKAGQSRGTTRDE